jgi:hypothetical protein
MGIPVSSTNKTDHHDIAEIHFVLLKVALNTINITLTLYNVLLKRGWLGDKVVQITKF